MTLLKKICAILIMGIGCGFGMVVYWGYVAYLYEWKGVIGFLIGIVTTPGVVIFPVIYWVIEDSFPLRYFLGMGIALVSFYLAVFLWPHDIPRRGWSR